MDVVQILVGLVLVSVIYHALVFYATLARKLSGKFAGGSSHPPRPDIPRGVKLWVVVLTLAVLAAGGYLQYQRSEDIRRAVHSGAR